MRTIPWDKFRVGVRVSLRVTGADLPTDRVGLVVDSDDATLTLEDRSGQLHRIQRAQVTHARLVPTVARGRNPRHAPPQMLQALAADPILAAPAGATCWIARLCDVVDHLDDTGVNPLPQQQSTQQYAGREQSRGLVNGEWAALRLVEADSLNLLAAWAARRSARNVVLTSPLPPRVLRELGLALLVP